MCSCVNWADEYEILKATMEGDEPRVRARLSRFTRSELDNFQRTLEEVQAAISETISWKVSLP